MAAVVRDAEVPRELDIVRRLWLALLTWGNDEMEARHGFRVPVAEAVEEDIDNIDRFQRPDGRLLLAFVGATPVGTAAIRWLGVGTCEIKRMWVEPANRRDGTGGAMLDRLLAEAGVAGYVRVRLDSPDFMTAAHDLYRSRGFRDIGPFAGTDVPEQHRSHTVFMEKSLL
jgi:GNAT superfamily N-acetyltransferase